MLLTRLCRAPSHTVSRSNSFAFLGCIIYSCFSRAPQASGIRHLSSKLFGGRCTSISSAGLSTLSLSASFLLSSQHPTRLLSSTFCTFTDLSSMAIPSSLQLAVLPILLVHTLFLAILVSGQPLVPALFIFGDSTVDVGNNNYLETIVKANFAPYGRDFDTKQPTGRFCDGKLATDYTASLLGFTSFPLPYLSPQATGLNLTTGVNFASGGSGFFDSTAQHFNVIPMSKQLELFKEYHGRLQQVVGSTNATSIISQALYVISAGNSDFVQNYYINLRLRKLYTVAQFSEIILGLAAKFVEDLYSLGARRIGVVSLAPFGCLPAEITLSRGGNSPAGNSPCVQSLNQVANAYNQALNTTINRFPASLPNLKIAYFDIYSAFLDILKNPSANGFTETSRACCGTGTIETAILCNKYSPGTCSNASQYVFWDSFHPSQAANQILANSLLLAGIGLVT